MKGTFNKGKEMEEIKMVKHVDLITIILIEKIRKAIQYFRQLFNSSNMLSTRLFFIFYLVGTALRILKKDTQIAFYNIQKKYDVRRRALARTGTY